MSIYTPLKVAAAVTVITSSLSAMATTQSNPQQVDRLIQQWSKIEQQRSLIESQWETRRVTLKQQTSLLDTEYRTLQQVLSEDQHQTGNVEQKREELLQQQTQLEQQQTELATYLATSLSNTLELHHRLPPPLQQAWQQAIDAIDIEQADISQRLELQLQLLSQLEDFKGRIALHQSVMKLDSQEVQVWQFYMGIARGWYVDNNGQYAGYGFSTDEGWQWLSYSQVDGLTPDELLAIIHILHNQTHASLRSLPLHIEPVTPLGVSTQ